MNESFKTGIVKQLRDMDGIGMLREVDTNREYFFSFDGTIPFRVNDVVTFNPDQKEPYAFNVFPSDVAVPDLNLVSTCYVVEHKNFLGAIPVIYFKNQEVDENEKRVKAFPNVFEARKHILKVNGHA